MYCVFGSVKDSGIYPMLASNNLQRMCGATGRMSGMPFSYRKKENTIPLLKPYKRQQIEQKTRYILEFGC